MANQQSSKPTPFEFVMYEGDAENMRTVTVTPNEDSPWIDPSSLKLRHRIGRGPFGDVWLATHHQSTADYDQNHEVAIKILTLVKDENVKTVLDKFGGIFSKCRAVKGVCWLHGISVIDGKISIVMKFYEGSVGDKMARLKGGRLSLPDVLRFGIDLAQAISDLHSQDIIVLNLKPSNFLLNETNQAILGDIGIPHLLLGLPLSDNDTSITQGSPHYMAPEQWDPKVRGPVSFESDSWGFACSILEMLTGEQPWTGRTRQKIYESVVLNQEKPPVPGGLPIMLENVLFGCFEFDFRNRPRMTHILQAFKSCREATINSETPFLPNTATTTIHPNKPHYTEWYISKDTLREGDIVRSRKPPNSSQPENMLVPEGKIITPEESDKQNGFILVRVLGIHDPLKVKTSTLERVTHGLASGDWVRLRGDHKHHSPVGILHEIHRDGVVLVGFIGLGTLWKGTHSDLQLAQPYHIGQFVRIKVNVFTPRFDWPRKRETNSWATGKIVHIYPNGCLSVKFPGILRFPFGQTKDRFLADPDEVEAVSFDACVGIVRKYQHLEDFHWAVRPILVALGLFTAMKMGLLVGKKMGKAKMKKKEEEVGQPRDGVLTTDGGANSAWLPPAVATMIFREG